MKNNKKNRKGLTLIELLVVIAIIGILASVVTVSLSGGRQKARDSSVLQSMNSVAPLAYRCMVKAKDTTNGRLTYPGSATEPTSICFGNTIDLNEFSAWPDIASTGWGYSEFEWCNINFSGSTHPTDTGDYSDGSRGGGRLTGKFCFVLSNSNPDRWIWCTENGCGKEGF